MTLPSSAHDYKHAHMQPVVHTATHFEDTFWAPRLQTIRTSTLPFIYEQMKKDGHFEAFRDVWKAGMHPIPYLFWESDISKWIEAASYSLALQADPELIVLVDEAIAFLLSLQQPDGYLNLWFTQVEPDKRWSNLRDYHELYCAGHLIEAAVAHFQVTGQRLLLDAVCRYADYIDLTFGPQAGKRRGYCGHEEIELALIKLYHATAERRYLLLSKYFIEERGQQPHYFDLEAVARHEDPADFWAKTHNYSQSQIPVRQQQEVTGHAVRAMYLLCAVSDLAREFDDAELQQVGERLWQHLCSRSLYVTGGLGSSADNEGFTADYDLPNLTAYAETCAGIGLVMWAHRMALATTDRRYADVMEQALYNGVLSSINFDGTGFFYVNPLESHGTHHREPWFNCACCPPNIARLLLSLGEYIYSVNESEIFVHLYMQSTTSISVGNKEITLRQRTEYPWEGTIRFELDMPEAAEFGLNLRIPGWCREAQLTVADEAQPLVLDKGYARIVRRWQPGDSLTLTLAMPVERVYAHPAIHDTIDSVALQRGPIVYCLETADNDVPLHQIQLPDDAVFETRVDPALVGGCVVIDCNSLIADPADWSDVLYRHTPPVDRTHTLTAIPYYAWDHRKSGEMRVWIQRTRTDMSKRP